MFLFLQLYTTIIFPSLIPFSPFFFVVYLLQLIAEFRRIVAKDLLESFLGGLDELVPSLLQLYKAAAASGRRLALSSILNCLQKEVCTV